MAKFMYPTKSHALLQSSARCDAAKNHFMHGTVSDRIHACIMSIYLHGCPSYLGSGVGMQRQGDHNTNYGVGYEYGIHVESLRTKE
jgi:hypothetical protein